MNRKTVIIIVVIVVIIIVAVAAYLIYKNVGKSNVEGSEEMIDEGDDDSGGRGYITPVIIPTADRPANVLDFQKFANSKGYTPKLVEDGLWGPKTSAAWSSLKNDYNSRSSCPEGTYLFAGGCRPIGGTTPKPTTGFQKGQNVKAKLPGLVFFKYPAGDSSIARLPNNFDINKIVGTYDSSAGNFSKIWVNASAVTISGNSIVRAPFWAYVYTNLIK